VLGDPKTQKNSQTEDRNFFWTLRSLSPGILPDTLFFCDYFSSKFSRNGFLKLRFLKIRPNLESPAYGPLTSLTSTLFGASDASDASEASI
jgi:hypothetical protein